MFRGRGRACVGRILWRCDRWVGGSRCRALRGHSGRDRPVLGGKTKFGSECGVQVSWGGGLGVRWGASTASIALRIRSDLMMPLDVRLAISEAFVEPEERHAMAGKVVRCGV